jgi:acyl-coenzyme A thioesterase PaaI-like protein
VSDVSRSLQEQFFPELTCFGCGPANDKGLRLRSFAGDGGTVADFTPWPEHDNGLGFLNGGIICTVLDCHSATPMLLEAQRQGLLQDGVPLPFVTAGLSVQYRRPTPLAESVHLLARVTEADDSSVAVAVELWSQDKLRVQGEAIWKRWRQRT